ncbi:uncharacterized protein V2V93DRAFT_370699 [Kockiozyma suomiensis]|uniref:uncharacterized protein n=1 Tax=Kockiozyma suomiensis TaxID=1337062 RepID=UPI003342EA0F
MSPRAALSIVPTPFSADINRLSPLDAFVHANVHPSSSSPPSSPLSSGPVSGDFSGRNSLVYSSSSSAASFSLLPPILLRASSSPDSADLSASHSNSTSASSVDQDLAALQFSEDLTPSQHVSLGVRFYEKTQLEQAAYHFQEAAHSQNVPAMILYAIYLQHGWGARPDPDQALVWLNHAIGILSNSSSSTVDVTGIPPSPSISSSPFPHDDTDGGMILNSPLSSPRWKQPLGTAVCNLGKSYKSKTGNDHSEVMAMACFEIGAQLGDSDSMCEAAELWSKNGFGRPKDLYRAAALYRQAASQGNSSLENSWIYKEKYMRHHDAKSASATKRKSFFGRLSKKSSSVF